MSLSKITRKAPSPDPRLFKAYTEMPERLHPRVWRVLRWFGVACALGVVAASVLAPSLGLLLFWGVFVPVLPLVFLVAPPPDCRMRPPGLSVGNDGANQAARHIIDAQSDVPIPGKRIANACAWSERVGLVLAEDQAGGAPKPWGCVAAPVSMDADGQPTRLSFELAAGSIEEALHGERTDAVRTARGDRDLAR